METGYGLDGRGSIPAEIRDFFYPIVSTPIMGPTHPLIHWVPGDLSPGAEQSDRGLKMTIHFHLLLRLNMAELYLHPSDHSGRAV
jgi:hypothetical protein